MPRSDTAHSPLIEPDVQISRIRLSQKRSPVGPDSFWFSFCLS
jgi:hypothetical protein